MSLARDESLARAAYIREEFPTLEHKGQRALVQLVGRKEYLEDAMSGGDNRHKKAKQREIDAIDWVLDYFYALEDGD